MIMPIIQKSLQVFFNFFKEHKKKQALFIVVFLLFFFLKFPYQSAMSYLVQQVEEQTKSAVQLQYEGFYINPLNLSLVFKKPEIRIKKYQSVLRGDRLSLRPSYGSLIRGKLGGVFTLKWPDSLLELNVRKQKTGLVLHIRTQDFNPSVLSSFVSLLANMKGQINLNMELFLDPLFETQPEGSWSLQGHSFQSQALSYTFPAAVGAISLPHWKWTRLYSSGTISKGDIAIEELSLGEKQDSFQIQTRGVITMDFSRQRFSGRVIPNFRSYNLGLQILVKEEIHSKLSFLDWFLEKVKKKTPQGFEYLTQIKGSKALFEPLPIDKLPTLNDLKKTSSETNLFTSD